MLGEKKCIIVSNPATSFRDCNGNGDAVGVVSNGHAVPIGPEEGHPEVLHSPVRELVRY